MSDRPQEIARKLWDVLSHEPDPRPERTVNVIAIALRAYAEEAGREPLGLLRLIAEEALGNSSDEYVSVPTQYVQEAARLAAIRTHGEHDARPVPQPSDFLETALRSVPLNELEIYYPALAAAVRDCVKARMPQPQHDAGYARSWQNGYNSALADMARRLGL